VGLDKFRGPVGEGEHLCYFWGQRRVYAAQDRGLLPLQGQRI
jgi:hypothetical protein